MRFILLIEAHGCPEANRRLRDAVGPQMLRRLQSGEVVETAFPAPPWTW